MVGRAAVKPSPWLPLRSSQTANGLALLCFPYAGGGAAVFREWFDELPGSIEALPVELPGRGTRMREEPMRSVEAVAEAAMDALEQCWQRPFALYGHSLGSVIAFELARRLVSRGRPPLHLFVAARRAPQLPATEPPAHALPSAQFRERLRAWGGTPPGVLASSELMILLEPILRADLEAAETYRCASPPDLGCPVTAFAGLADNIVTPHSVEAWSACTSGYFAFRPLPGNHFFLHHNRSLLLATLASEVERAATDGAV